MIAKRVLALDLRPRRAGYAAFEGSARLLDAGFVRFKSRRDGMPRVAFLIKIYRPQVVVLRKIPRRSKRNHPETRHLSALVRRLVESTSIGFAEISENQLAEYAFGTRNKHETARRIAAQFPQLAWRVPPPRRLWQSERPRMSLFDAVTYGVVYFRLNSDEGSSEQQSNSR